MSDTAKQPHEAFKVDDELEKEFQKALSYELRDEDIERASLLLGIDVASGARELNCEANQDSMRNWALGVGDDACQRRGSRAPRFAGEECALFVGDEAGLGEQLVHAADRLVQQPAPFLGGVNRLEPLLPLLDDRLDLLQVEGEVAQQRLLEKIVAIGKPTVLVLASQHGNEQSGKEAALALIRDLAVGERCPSSSEKSGLA